MIRTVAIFLLICSAAALGCARASHQNYPATSVNSALLFAGDPLADESFTQPAEGDWVLSRNDERLGSLAAAEIPVLNILEVRQRDFLRTINGRPREYSTTLTSSVRRAIVR